MASEGSRWRWPWQRSLQNRIVLSYGAIFAVVLIALMVWVGRVVYVAQRDQVIHNLERQAYLAANVLEDPLSGFGVEFENEARRHREDEERNEHDERVEVEPRVGARSATGSTISRLQGVAVSYAADTGARVTILDNQGYAIADSQQDPRQLARQLSEQAIAALSNSGSVSAVHVDPTSGAPALYVTAPVISGSRLLGFVQFAFPMEGVTRGIWTLVLTLGGFGLLALLVSALLGVLIARRLVYPVRSLEEASLAMASGDLSQRVVVNTEDEMGSLARAFNHMADEVQRMMEQQRAFVANASHELRTPLTNIKLRSEALLKGTDDPAVRQRFLREIDQESDRLARLANALLDLAKFGETQESGASTSDPLDVLRGVFSLMSVRAENADTRLEANLPSVLPRVKIGSDALETILVNLLDNALKYTPAGGAVALSARVAGEWLSIEVRDTGQGIPEADLLHVFERFYRVDKSRSRHREPGSVGSGAGLGLAIVKQLVDRYGGRIEIESKEGKGTAVTLSVRIAPGTVAEPGTRNDRAQ